MNTTSNIKKVAFLFFLILMSAQLFATLMVANGYSWSLLPPLKNSLALPALLSGILYAFSSMKLYFEEGGKKTEILDLIAGILGGLIVIAALIVDFFL